MADEPDQPEDTTPPAEAEAETKDAPGTDESEPKPSPAEQNKPASEKDAKPAGKFKRLWRAYLTKKKWTIPATVAAIVLVVLAIPASRYPVLGLVLKHPLAVTVNDSVTNQPVSGVDVTAAGRTAQTDGAGKATLGKVPVGPHKLEVTKKYYQDLTTDTSVPLGHAGSASVQLVAIGRQVPVTVINKITGQAVKDAVVAVLDTTAKTDDKGKTTIVLPTTAATQKGVIKLTGYNDSNVTVTVTDQVVKDNNFAITPAGKLYFLSKLSGKIDVVKTDLDGGNRQTVVAGTGKEDDTDTVLLASRDWKFLALKAKRDSDQPKLYLIDTSTDKLTTMDEGDAAFTLTGWLDHYFIYKVDRNTILNWQPKKQAIKSFNADHQQIYSLDETNAEGSGPSDYASEYFENVYALKTAVVFVKDWQGFSPNNRLNGKQAQIISVHADGTAKTTVKALGLPSGSDYGGISFESRTDEADSLYFKFDPNSTFYKYDNGQVTPTADVNDDNFYNTAYPTYLLSPAGKETFWADARDGKNTLFIGDDQGHQGKQIASLSEYSPYGWYTDNYLLVSKNGSELYIMPRSGSTPLKVSDYHKPALNFRGYGGGYGGI